MPDEKTCYPQNSNDINGFRSTLNARFKVIRALLAERDKRYTERFEGIEKSIAVGLLAQEKAVSSALAASKEAIIKAETATEKRFDSTNEFREQLNDYGKLLMPRREAEAAIQQVKDALIAQIAELTRRSEENRQSILEKESSLRLEIQSLRESRSADMARDEVSMRIQKQSFDRMALTLASSFAVVQIVSGVILFIILNH